MAKSEVLGLGVRQTFSGALGVNSVVSEPDGAVSPPPPPPPPPPASSSRLINEADELIVTELLDSIILEN